jgi:translation initiation factor 1
MEICPKCGLPIQACVCGEIGKAEQKIKVESKKIKFGKTVTLVTGFQNIDIEATLKELKHRLACGGTFKNNAIELQGDHKSRVKPVLVKLGFDENFIDDK